MDPAANDDNSLLEQSYDEAPYPTHICTPSHPDRLSAVARLHGMNPAPVDRCRVLEIGCATGANLIPMADGLPGSEFLGIDFSAQQIAEAQATTSALQLKNIRFVQQDLQNIPADLGLFDYIIAHGVYSWVPPEVAESLLRVSAGHLAPNGIAFISYNTYPGWHLREIARGIMCYAGRNASSAQARAAEARRMLDFVAESAAAAGARHAPFLQGERDLIRAAPDAYLLHDHLEHHNHPCYFHQFVDRASTKGLKYVADAESRPAIESTVQPAVRQVLSSLATEIEREQYRDFIAANAIRNSILCHAAPAPTDCIDASSMLGLYLQSHLKRSPDGFIAAGGTRIATANPLANEILGRLADVAPHRTLFDDLLRSAAHNSGASLGEARTIPASLNGIATFLFELYLRRFIDLYTRPADFISVPSQAPIARPLCRYHALRGTSSVTLLHTAIRMDETTRIIVPLLDGTRNRQQLADALQSAIKDGRLKIGTSLDHLTANQQNESILRGLESALVSLAAAGVLIG